MAPAQPDPVGLPPPLSLCGQPRWAPGNPPVLGIRKTGLENSLVPAAACPGLCSAPCKARVSISALLAGQHPTGAGGGNSSGHFPKSRVPMRLRLGQG